MCVFVGCGCVILNGVSLKLLEQCLPLVTKSGLFIVTIAARKASAAREKIKSVFSFSQTAVIKGTGVVVGCNRELRPNGQQYRSVAQSVNEKLNYKNPSGVTNDLDFNDALFHLTLEPASDVL